MAEWHSLASARQLWRDAPSGDAQLTELLESAKEQCIEYAPVLTDPNVVPSRYRVAQLMQTRALWTAQQTGPDNAIGIDGMQVRVYPMDWQVKALLRPPQGVPGIG